MRFILRFLRFVLRTGILIEPEALRAVERWLRSLWQERLDTLTSLVEEQSP